MILSFYLFCLGFMLTRPIIHWRSEEKLNKRVDRVVIILIDALRFDFAFKTNSSFHYSNKLTFLHKNQGYSRIFKFIADAPTTTVQRLKALGTGSLSSFFEMSFFGEIENEDNIFMQLKQQNRSIVFMGDDTWMSLYGNCFLRSFPFPSLDVWDINSVDLGIKQIIYQELKKKDWTVLIAHFLGVDHIGHKFGANHPEMALKLLDLNKVITNVTKDLGENDLLLVFGDHGMKEDGGHGGGSLEETNSALFAFSKSNVFYKNIDIVNQIDLVPTLSVLLGVPIPYQNLGTIIPTFFNDSQAYELNRNQINRYMQHLKLNATLENALEICRKKWSRFDPVLMLSGILHLFLHLLLFNFNYKMFLPLITSLIYFSNSLITFEDFVMFYILQTLLWFHGFNLEKQIITFVSHLIAQCHEDRKYCHYQNSIFTKLTCFYVLFKTKMYGFVIILKFIEDRFYLVWSSRILFFVFLILFLQHKSPKNMFLLLSLFSPLESHLALYNVMDTIISTKQFNLVFFALKHAFFATNHQAEIAKIPWKEGFFGLFHVNFFISPLLIWLNLMGHTLFLFYFRGDLNSLKLCFLFHLMVSCLAILFLRDALHLYKIFAPRWMLSCLETLSLT